VLLLACLNDAAQLEKELGAGAYGTVWKASYQGMHVCARETRACT
jgi:hypothetical protein